MFGEIDAHRRLRPAREMSAGKLLAFWVLSLGVGMAAQTPAGKPIERGPDFSTVQEMLSLIGAGKGIFPVPAHARRYDTRPDITYIPIRDGLPRERRLTWRITAETSRIRAFNQTVREFVDVHANPLVDADPQSL